MVAMVLTAVALSLEKTPLKLTARPLIWAAMLQKNLVAAGLADRVLVQLAYAIGVAEPVSVNVNAFGTEKVALDRLEAAAREYFQLRPAGIIESLNLLRPIYAKTAAYGHFGRPDPDFFLGTHG